ncbi:serine/threonine-protein kinase Sgk2-like [Condylostylus longicornis]|uniref:serine/threonine-protein kinase Sgk2-like n=1 Tax=Condylostylus longicornis TaxID=2530218 RepID=UPI00244E171E|nr:serine/threonine-protein kinase Sgk2-like [Condylostylus longicornis]
MYEDPASEMKLGELGVVTDNLANLALQGGISKYSQRKVSPEDFVLLKVIGKGSYGKVMMVRYKQDGGVYAMKMLRKENIIKRNQVEHTKTERNVLESINHPFIVQLYFAFQTPKKLYFVMEYCPGGELFFHLSLAGRLSEGRARYYASEIVLALEHLHKLDIVYRDLKPENVLLDEEGHVRLTDFGLSKEGVQDNFSAKSLCGTPEYLAPEILNQTGHGKAVDWWSLGALIYEMLTGLPPFYTRDRELLFENIRSAELRYPSFISPVAKSLLIGLFQRDPNRRLGGGKRDAEEIKAHPFFATVDWQRVYYKLEPPPFRPTLVSKTDVQYFDKEFVKLPANNSEVPDSALSQAVRDDMFQGFSYDGRNDGYSRLMSQIWFLIVPNLILDSVFRALYLHKDQGQHV